MISRVESAAATRRALLDAAAELLDSGGPEAVTLREVGARAGVSRGAPYRHFADKEALLVAVATEAWRQIGDDVEGLRAASGLSPTDKLRAALTAFVAIGRRRPHLYQMMFSSTAMAGAAQHSQDGFIAIIGELVGDEDARRYAALLMAGAHGVIGMEVGGQLTVDKWQTSAEELVAVLVAITTEARDRTWPRLG